MKDKIFKLSEVESVAKELLLPHVTPGAIFAFYGPLGAGKTTLIKNFLAQCGVKEAVTSPTFAYVNTYAGDNGQLFYHFDLYRLNTLESFIELGFDEMVLNDSACSIIEWPEVIEGLLEKQALKNRVLKIRLSYVDENKRKIVSLE